VEKKKMIDTQAMNFMLTCGIPITKSMRAALTTKNPARSLGMIVNALRDEDAEHIAAVLGGCVGAIAGLLMAVNYNKEDNNESA
jgi:branched-subunit amino acid ABC-type transport system permease component